MKNTVLYAVVSVLLVGLLALVMGLLYNDGGSQRAIAVGALVALVTQAVAFSIVRSLGPGQAMVGWGLGAFLRLLVLVLFALGVPRFGLPLAPALISLALFLFATTLVEPLFLKS